MKYKCDTPNCNREPWVKIFYCEEYCDKAPACEHKTHHGYLCKTHFNYRRAKQRPKNQQKFGNFTWCPVDKRMRIVNCPCGITFQTIISYQKYHSAQCLDNYKKQRKYHNNSDFRERKLMRNLKNSKLWRERCRNEGRCTRCGKHNSNAEAGYVVCTNCVIDIKDGYR